MGRVAVLLCGIWALAAAWAGAPVGSGSAEGGRILPDPASLQPLSRAEAERVFERFMTLEGAWRSHSTKGWDGRVRFSTIARRSAVLATSRFLSQDGGGMATLVHLDGDRLVLTHYCEARNQPRLVASSLSDDGRSVTFTFFDGTNLLSRDQGHMDKVVWRFGSDDTFTSRWTWYQDGRESWMEEIRHSRVRE